MGTAYFCLSSDLTNSDPDKGEADHLEAQQEGGENSGIQELASLPEHCLNRQDDHVHREGDGGGGRGTLGDVVELGDEGEDGYCTRIDKQGYGQFLIICSLQQVSGAPKQQQQGKEEHAVIGAAS